MCNKRIVSGQKCIAIALIVFPVGVTNNQNKGSDNFKLMHITATQMIAHYSINFEITLQKVIFITTGSVGKIFQGHGISGCAGRHG